MIFVNQSEISSRFALSEKFDLELEVEGVVAGAGDVLSILGIPKRKPKIHPETNSADAINK